MLFYISQAIMEWAEGTPWAGYVSPLRLFRYITFRAAGASITAFLFCLWAGPSIIAWLRSMKVTANNQREHAEKIHHLYKHKAEVPTMGGVMILGGSWLISRFDWLFYVFGLYLFLF